ncbi:hypothetical protein ILUMI_27114 [Ignelater luminosus]|uniref:RRM domain-containing protein n=1 Tax=Ignelater luminosus TaxID=2038154 RepID=A0A8K0FY15_IGNLU|nr:hypothetical protein ILUMI_27114 [Ignelater luminosus]
MNTLPTFQISARRQSRENILKAKLKYLEEQKGFPVVQINGQRVCGPPNKWNKAIPTPGSEIFVGHIPKWIIEDELMGIFSVVGNIYMIRLMVDFCGFNRGFAFITYENPDQANMAVKFLNNYEIRQKRILGVSKSVDNRRLFIGGIPQYKTKQDVQRALEYYTEDLIDVIVYPDQNGHHHNRGYVFAEFGSHRSAAIAKKLLSSGILLWEDTTVPVTVNWSDPVPEVDPSIMKTVKRLYVRNLPYHLTTKEMRLWLGQLLCMDSITKVHKINDYAFIHFNNRNNAELALVSLNGLTIEGKKIEVSWSRPRIYSKDARFNRPAENLCRSVPPKMYWKVQMLQNRNSSDPASPPGSSS